MRILYLDLDTLRPDHLGCYGYERNTSPNLDAVATRGVRFENCYATDAPCLPSRAGLYNSRFGLHTGIVNHGGTNAEMRIEGCPRGFRQNPGRLPWVAHLKSQGFKTVSISSFPERHSAWWFCWGWSEMMDPGKGGLDTVEDVEPLALDWIRRHGREDQWFLQVNYWDPHTPYRTPDSYGNPFEDCPAPSWLTEEMFQQHRSGFGSHSPQELWGWDIGKPGAYSRAPAELKSLKDFKTWIDGYDVGIHYMDASIGRLLSLLDDLGVLQDTAILISSDHGENQGELNIYGDHQTADHITSRVPLIMAWPGMKQGVVDPSLHYNLDLPPTTAELLAARSIPPVWQGQSFAKALIDGKDPGRDHLVVSQCAWSCQRSVRWDRYILIRTYHDGYKDFQDLMLFDVLEDPHETRNLVSERPEIAHRMVAMLENWQADMMRTSPFDVDPLWTVIREGGPLHTRGHLQSYCQRLRDTGRAHHAKELLKRHPDGV